MADGRKLIFIYNADSGRLAAMLDSVKKAVRSPKACALCTITHGLVSKRTEWADIERRLGLPAKYYHRDDMPDSVAGFLRDEGLRLPVILRDLGDPDGDGYSVAVDADALEKCRGEAACLGKLLDKALAGSAGDRPD